MISVYDVGNEHFDRNGDAVLIPSSCIMSEEAGGSYELALTHPVDESGKWSHILPNAIIKAPVPVAEIDSGETGVLLNVYRTIYQSAMREKPIAPVRINYPEWDPADAPNYEVGTKVSRSNLDRNYQIVYWHNDPVFYAFPPESLNSSWQEIPRYTDGGAVLAYYEAGTEVYVLDWTDPSGRFYKVMTKQGIIGYILIGSLEYVRTEEPQPIEQRTVKDQLFRIYSVSINSQNKTVTANARHVSYDMSGIILRDCDIKLASPALAIMRVQDSMMISHRGQIATNLTEEENGTITVDLSGKNAMHAFLNPDTGMVRYFRAKLMRDNWDLFVLKMDTFDRGVSLAYGKNLIGVDWKRNSENLVTRVVPIAKRADGSDLYLNSEIPWIDSPHLHEYPTIHMEILRVNAQIGKETGKTDDFGNPILWDEVSINEYMRAKAEERYSVDHADSIVNECSVDFTMLGDTEEFKQYKGLQKVFLYDRIRVYDPNIGLDITDLQVSAVEWDCILNRYRSIKIGNVFDYGGRTVSGYQIGEGAIDYDKISLAAVSRIISESKGA